jgi:hypothetical protein
MGNLLSIIEKFKILATLKLNLTVAAIITINATVL